MYCYSITYLHGMFSRENWMVLNSILVMSKIVYQNAFKFCRNASGSNCREYLISFLKESVVCKIFIFISIMI